MPGTARRAENLGRHAAAPSSDGAAFARAGITRRRLADAVGCHIQQIQRLDNGTAPLEGAGAGLVLRIARALGVTVEDLLDA